MPTEENSVLPLCDPHFHLWDVPNRPNPNLGNNSTYLASDYRRDMDLLPAPLQRVSGLHVETVVGQMPGGAVVDSVDELGPKVLVHRLHHLLLAPLPPLRPRLLSLCRQRGITRTKGPRVRARGIHGTSKTGLPATEVPVASLAERIRHARVARLRLTCEPNIE